MDLLRETGALLEGHFLLSSGKHTNRYVQCAKLLMYPEKAAKAIEPVVKQLKEVDFDLIVGPAMGGIIVAYELSRQTGKPNIFVERENGEMKLRRGFSIKRGQKIVIAEDVVTTGKSAYEAIKVVEESGGEVVGIASIVDRSNGEIKYPLYSGIKLDIQVYDEENCQLCKDNIEITKPGSRKIK